MKMQIIEIYDIHELASGFNIYPMLRVSADSFFRLANNH